MTELKLEELQKQLALLKLKTRTGDVVKQINDLKTKIAQLKTRGQNG